MPDTFTDFGGAFQDKLVVSVLIDKVFAEQIVEIIDTSFLDYKYHQDIMKCIISHYTQYKTIPSIDTIDTLLNDVTDATSKQQAKIFINALKEQLKTSRIFEDLQFIKDKSLDFCKKQNLKAALQKAADMLKYSKYDEIVEVIKNSVILGTSRDVGLQYIKDFEKRMQDITINTILTPWPAVNKVMNDGKGWGSRELHVFLAAVTKGKSHLLIQSGAEAIKQGFNVAHYTLELSDEKTALRYDSYFSKVPYDNLKKNKEKVWERINEFTKGHLIIKEYPTKMATCTTIRNHLTRLKMRGFEPNLVIVDYADLLKPLETKDSYRFELENIYENLRGIAGEFDIPVITASQATRSSAEEDLISLESISESYLKAAVADTVISFSRTISDMALGTARFFIAKNRSGISGFVYNLMVDTEISEIKTISDEPIMPDQLKKRQSTKDVWNSVKNGNKEKS